MTQTRRLLLTAFYSAIIIAVATSALFECDIIATGDLARYGTSEYVVATVMELLTLAVVPVALRMFKFEAVARNLQANGAEALRRWGLLRISMLGLPLVGNTLLYYIYMATPFGYMAIILLISMVFVYPSLGRCMAETEKMEEGTDE